MNKKYVTRDSLFKTSAKEYIEQKELDSGQLDRFENLLGGYTEEARPKESNTALGVSRRTSVYMAITASVVMLLMMSLNLYLQQPSKIGLIANEVAMNHIKMKPLELKTEQLPPLRDYFTQLDFSIVNSSIFSQQNNSMLGGRYCSIQGVTAAQIRYQTAAGKKVTLYEVGYDPQIYGVLPDVDKGEKPLYIEVKGISVNLWVEKGLLMAEARDIGS